MRFMLIPSVFVSLGHHGIGIVLQERDGEASRSRKGELGSRG